MRVLLAVGMAAALALVACGGCSSTRMPSFPTFGFKGKSSKPRTSKLSNAPPGPELNSMTGTSPPNVSMPPSSAWNNLPVYPGTNYQQTPYSDTAMASAPAAYSSNGAAPPAATVPMGSPGTSAYASNYAAMPPAESVGPSSPYATYPASGGQAPAYSGQQVPTYSPQAAAPYAQGQSSASGGQQGLPYTAAAPSYAQQPSPPATGGASPYVPQQAAPYSAPQDPYGATSEPYNAANPYGSYAR